MYPLDRGQKRKVPAAGSLQATSISHENLPLPVNPRIEISTIPFT